MKGYKKGMKVLIDFCIMITDILHAWMTRSILYMISYNNCTCIIHFDNRCYDETWKPQDMLD